MEISLSKRFLKDLALIPSKQRKEIEHFVFDILPLATTLGDLKIFEKMSGYDHCYKARFGSYRLGAYFDHHTLELRRVMNRKDIYKFFP